MSRVDASVSIFPEEYGRGSVRPSADLDDPLLGRRGSWLRACAEPAPRVVRGSASPPSSATARTAVGPRREIAVSRCEVSAPPSTRVHLRVAEGRCYFPENAVSGQSERIRTSCHIGKRQGRSNFPRSSGELPLFRARRSDSPVMHLAQRRPARSAKPDRRVVRNMHYSVSPEAQQFRAVPLQQDS
jgi:hypothetical protein